MIRLLYILTVMFGLSTFVNGQTMESVFVEIPDEYIPQLDDAWRKDLISLYKDGKTATLQNSMNGYSTLKNMTDDYLLLQVSDKSTVEMKLLPLVNDTKLVCMVTTVYGPAPDSRIQFFTSEWKPLESTDLFTPVDKNWFFEDGINSDEIGAMEVKSNLDMDLFKYSLSPDGYTLTEEYTTPLYLSKEERNKAEKYLKDSPKTYTWEKSHFK